MTHTQSQWLCENRSKTFQTAIKHVSSSTCTVQCCSSAAFCECFSALVRSTAPTTLLDSKNVDESSVRMTMNTMIVVDSAHSPTVELTCGFPQEAHSRIKSSFVQIRCIQLESWLKSVSCWRIKVNAVQLKVTELNVCVHLLVVYFDPSLILLINMSSNK